MKLEGEFEVATSASKLWDFLWDLESLGTCLPGCEGVVRIDERTLTGVIGVRVGPIQAKFQSKAIIIESEPPARVVLKAEGEDKLTASRIRATIEMWLRPLDEDVTRAGYRADIAIIGKLGQFGDGVIRETAGVLLEQFASNIRDRMKGDDHLEGARQMNILKVLIKALWRWITGGLHRFFHRFYVLLRNTKHPSNR